MVFHDIFNLVQIYKDIEPRYGRTRTRGFFSVVRVVSFTSLFYKFQCGLCNEFYYGECVRRRLVYRHLPKNNLSLTLLKK